MHPDPKLTDAERRLGVFATPLRSVLSIAKPCVGARLSTRSAMRQIVA